MSSTAVLLCCVLATACAGVPTRSPTDVRREPQSPQAAGELPWELAASVSYYALPDDADYVMPVVTADHGALHLEARYAYEDRDTASLWAGWNFGIGDDLRLDATLMAGAAFGNTAGVAPGYRLSLGYGVVELSSEGEHLFDLDAHEDDFFYSWSELSAAPTEWLRAGAAGQRTRVFGGEREIDRGLLVELGVRGATLTVYAFEPWGGDRYWVFAGGVEF